MAWKKGESGNPGGTIKHRKFLEALLRAVAADDGKRLRKAAEELLTQSAKGESWAIKELADRLDGRPHQSVDLGNPDGSSIFSTIHRVIIENK